MFIAQAFNVLHDWWRYLVGLVIVIIAVTIGQIPLTIAVFFKAYQNGDAMDAMDQTKMLSLLEPNLNLFLMLISFAAGLLGLFFVVKYLHKQSITHLTTSRKKIDWKRFWLIFFVWGIFSSGMVIVDYFMHPENYVVNFNLVPFLILCVIAIIFVPLQTSFEEYLFRGYLMQGIGVGSTGKKFPLVFIYLVLVILAYLVSKYICEISIWWGLLQFIFFLMLGIFIFNSKYFEKIMNSNFYQKLYYFFKKKYTPLFITSLIFGLLHIANPEVEKLGYFIMVYYIGTGLFLGIMTLMDDGLELSLGFHAANNLFTALLVTADWTAFQTHSVLKDMSNPSDMGLGEIFLPVFVVFPVLLFILSKIYNWTDWKEKLFGNVVEPLKEPELVLENSNFSDN